MVAGLFQACIHEYPHITPGPQPGKGEDPTTIETTLEVSFYLSWDNMLHLVGTTTKANSRTERPHRFILEIRNGDSLILNDIFYLSDEEFSFGKVNHRLSRPLGASLYNVAVWYDREDDNGIYSFNGENLEQVRLINFSTTDVEATKCAWGSDLMDLTPYENTKETVSFELQLDHPGARFEIVATDVQEFITNNKDALNQGDQFTVHLLFKNGAFPCFNLYTGNAIYDQMPELSGKMRLPFAEYDELKIAEGFIFCQDQDEVSLRLNVTNSALFTVSGPPEFSFPVKRGYTTIVKGDFLTSMLDGIFSINHIWDGEIIIEI